MPLPLLAQTPPLVQSLLFKALSLPTNALTTTLYSFAIVAAVFVPSIMLWAMFAIWWERKVAGRIQSRHGPNRVGPVGLLQSLADGIKLITKEDLTPGSADWVLFKLAPYLTVAPVFAAFMALPWGPEMTFEPRLSVGLFWILAILSVEVLGIILGGWASHNKWAIFGAMREACQMVSYEIPLGLSLIVGVMAAGTLNLVDLGHLQSGGVHTWIIFRNPFVLLAFISYFIASLASTKRAPFDLPESESELVAGFHTEYSGLRFSFFFFAEYAAMFVVGAIQVALFLGGWNDPFGLVGYYHNRFQLSQDQYGLLALNLIAVGIFISKVLMIVYVQMWIRWTLPRPRIDQVLHACMKVLLPFGCLLLLGAGFWQLFVNDRTGIPWRDYQPWRYADWSHSHGALATQSVLAILGLTTIGLITIWVFYAIASGRSIKQRLTDPAKLDLSPPPLLGAKAGA